MNAMIGNPGCAVGLACGPNTPDLDEIVRLEPELAVILAQAVGKRRLRPNDRYLAYSDIKKRTDDLVGWGARNPRLRSEAAYDCYMDEIIQALGI